MNRKSQVDNKKSKKNTNRHFFQFNTLVTPQILYKLADYPLSLKVLALLLHCSDKLGAVVIEQKYIQKFTNRRRSSINNAIRYLRKLGVITVTKMDTRNAYIMNPKLIWQESYNKRHYVTNNFTFNNIYNIRNDKKMAHMFDEARESSYQIPYDKFHYIKNRKY